MNIVPSDADSGSSHDRMQMESAMMLMPPLDLSGLDDGMIEAAGVNGEDLESDAERESGVRREFGVGEEIAIADIKDLTQAAGIGLSGQANTYGHSVSCKASFDPHQQHPVMSPPFSSLRSSSSNDSIASSSSSIPRTIPARYARILFLQHRNKQLNQRVKALENELERVKASTRNYIEQLKEENEQMKARVVMAERVLARMNKDDDEDSDTRIHSSSASSSASSSRSSSGDHDSMHDSTLEQSMDAQLRHHLEAEIGRLQDKIHFYETQIADGDESMQQAKEAWKSSTSILQSELLSLQQDLTVSHEMESSLRNDLDRCQALLNDASTRAQKKEAQYQLLLSRFEAELTESKVRMATMAEAMREQEEHIAQLEDALAHAHAHVHASASQNRGLASMEMASSAASTFRSPNIDPSQALREGEEGDSDDSDEGRSQARRIARQCAAMAARAQQQKQQQETEQDLANQSRNTGMEYIVEETQADHDVDCASGAYPISPLEQLNCIVRQRQQQQQLQQRQQQH